MSDFLSKMKSIFIESEQVKANPNEKIEEQANQKNIEISQQSQKVTHNDPVILNNTAANLDKHGDQFYSILFKAIESHNQAGFDYIEFRNTLSSLENVISDEKTRFLSAFAGAQAAGSNIDTLVSSSEYYVNILDNESKLFDESIQIQWERQVKNRENEIAQLKQLILEKEQSISKFQNEMEDHKAILLQLNNEIENSKSKIEKTKSDFIATLELLKTKIRNDKDKINTYLKK